MPYSNAGQANQARMRLALQIEELDPTFGRHNVLRRRFVAVASMMVTDSKDLVSWEPSFDFTGAKGLSDANLKDADLTDVKGLWGSEFAAKDITGCKLPEDLHEFKTLEVVEETSKNARKILYKP